MFNLKIFKYLSSGLCPEAYIVCRIFDGGGELAMFDNKKLTWAILISNLCIILLLAANLVVSLNRQGFSTAGPDRKLPDGGMMKAFSAEERDAAVTKLIQAYNSDDYSGFYAAMGDFAKAKLSYRDVIDDIQKVKAVFGNVVKFTFSNYGFDGEKDGVSWIRFIYRASFDKGPGQVRINVRYAAGKWEMVGFKYDLDDRQ